MERHSYFTPDDHQTPIYRFGRFHHLVGPGYFWLIPFIEEAQLPINTGLRVGEYTFVKVLSHDNVPFQLHVTVLYRLALDKVSKEMLPQVVRLTADTVQKIVADYANRGVRRLAAAYPAATLTNKAIVSSIEQELGRLLNAQLRILGITPLRSDGVLIKEIIAPAAFQEAMLEANRQRTILCLFNEFDQRHAADYALFAQFLQGLEKHQQVNLFGAFDQFKTAYFLNETAQT